MTKNEITKQNDFNLLTLKGELAEAIAEEMDGLGTLPFDNVKIPSGGGISFEIPGEDEDDPETTKELIGVILHHYPVNAYWAESYTGKNTPPDCASLNGKQGIRAATGEAVECSSCPYNEYGSGKDGNGKACKNTHRCYILRENNPIPLLLTLPPTSLKYLRDYLGKKVILKGMRSFDCITKITLKKEISSGGITYSRAAFAFVKKLDEEQRAEARAMAEMVKNMTQPDITTEDYLASPSKQNEFTEVIDEEPVPVTFTETAK